jgi:hypothetical protein
MMQKWNLSELAVRHKTLTLYFIIVSLIIGTLAFFQTWASGRPELYAENGGGVCQMAGSDP